ncbi:unnamed protein product [Schistosoma turkestanicum]|nr:unnamed protein product [Schistosoma turkestanicum]
MLRANINYDEVPKHSILEKYYQLKHDKKLLEEENASLILQLQSAEDHIKECSAKENHLSQKLHSFSEVKGERDELLEYLEKEEISKYALESLLEAQKRRSLQLEAEAVMFEAKETMLNNKIIKLEKQLTKRDEQIADLINIIHDCENLLSRNEEQVTKKFHEISTATSELCELRAKVEDIEHNINLMQIFSSNFDEAEENKRPILSHEGIGMHSQRTPTLWSNVPSDVRERFPMTFVSGYAFPTRSFSAPSVFFSGKYEKKRSTVKGKTKQLTGTNCRNVNQEKESLENNKLFYMSSFENAKCIQSSQCNCATNSLIDHTKHRLSNIQMRLTINPKLNFMRLFFFCLFCYFTLPVIINVIIRFFDISMYDGSILEFCSSITHPMECASAAHSVLYSKMFDITFSLQYPDGCPPI